MNEAAQNDLPEAWQTIPEESLDALLVHNILRTHHYLCPCIDRSLKELNLSGIQLNVMLLLKAAPDGLPLSEIGRRLVVTRANVTGLIDRLEQKGLVLRRTADDRRVILATLTAEGLRIVGDVLPRHRELLAKVGGCLEPHEKRQVVVLLSKLREKMRETGLHHHPCHPISPPQRESAPTHAEERSETHG